MKAAALLLLAACGGQGVYVDSGAPVAVDAAADTMAPYADVSVTVDAQDSGLSDSSFTPDAWPLCSIDNQYWDTYCCNADMTPVDPGTHNAFACTGGPDPDGCAFAGTYEFGKVYCCP